MIELFETDRYENDRHSSKGNQLKWSKNGIWYKADNLGYEGMSETVVSKLLIKSDLKKDAYVSYEPEQIRYKNKVYMKQGDGSSVHEDRRTVPVSSSTCDLQ